MPAQKANFSPKALSGLGSESFEEVGDLFARKIPDRLKAKLFENRERGVLVSLHDVFLNLSDEVLKGVDPTATVALWAPLGLPVRLAVLSPPEAKVARHRPRHQVQHGHGLISTKRRLPVSLMWVSWPVVPRKMTRSVSSFVAP